MPRFKRIKTTVPGRTLGARRLRPTTHSIYLRLSYLALEKQRRLVEITNLEGRLDTLRKRLLVIDKEAEKLHSLGDLNREPLPADAPAPSGTISIRY